MTLYLSALALIVIDGLQLVLCPLYVSCLKEITCCKTCSFASQLCWIISLDIPWHVYANCIFLCTLLLLSLWQHPAKSPHPLLLYGRRFESLLDRQAYLPISLPSCFTAADFAMALNSLDDSVVPKKKHCCFFFSPVTQRERLGHKSIWGEAVVFCPGRMGFIALHKELIGGLFCVRVDFTADCVHWSSRKTK